MRLAHVAFTSLLLVTPDQQADSRFEDAAEQLTPALSAAVTGGSWEESGNRGQYRVLVFDKGLEHVSSEVFLQWLAETEDGSRVLRNIPVAELSTGFWSVGVPMFRAGRRATFELGATNPYSLENTRFVLRPQLAGKYTISQVKRKRK